MMTTTLNLDPAFYRDGNPDLRHFTDEELAVHFTVHGSREGRAGSAISVREGLLAMARQADEVLEIGPFCNPAMQGPNVKYFDVLDSQHLAQRAAEIGYPIQHVPEINFVSPTGDLAVVDAEFDAVVSAHCIEHQPDLIAHLNKVENILRPDGKYFLIIPDKRYCFDHFIPEKSIADVLQAQLEGRKVHTMASVIEHRALVTHNDCGEHWAGNHGALPPADQLALRVVSAIAEYRRNEGSYIDVHAWQFTPAGFLDLLNSLHEMKLIKLRPMAVCATARGRNEFTAILGLDTDLPGSTS